MSLLDFIVLALIARKSMDKNIKIKLNLILTVCDNPITMTPPLS